MLTARQKKILEWVLSNFAWEASWDRLKYTRPRNWDEDLPTFNEIEELKRELIGG